MTGTDLRAQAVDDIRSTLGAFDWSRLTDGRKQILDAFLRVATAEGYASVSMRTLGARLNVKAPTLYSHFPGGKDELVGMALRWRFYQWASGAVEALDRTGDAHDFFETLVDYYVRNQLTMAENEMFDLLLANDRYAAKLPSEAREESEQFILLLHNLVSGVIHDLGHRDPQYAAGIVISLLDSARNWSRPSDPGEALDGRVAEALAIVAAILDRVDALDDAALSTSAPTIT